MGSDLLKSLAIVVMAPAIIVVSNDCMMQGSATPEMTFNRYLLMAFFCSSQIEQEESFSLIGASLSGFWTVCKSTSDCVECIWCSQSFGGCGALLENWLRMQL